MRLADRLWTPRAGSPSAKGVRAVELFETWRANYREGNLDNFVDYVQTGYQNNGVVFGVILARMSLLSEASFAFRNRGSRKLFTTAALAPLEEPWVGGSTGEMIARMEQDASLAGNAYIYRDPRTGKMQRLRPDWVKIVSDGQAVVGYVYERPGAEPKMLPAEDVAHWSPIPDPEGNFRGMSWLTPVTAEILADSGMTEHKRRFLKNAATPNMVISVEEYLPADVKRDLREVLAQRHEGVENAYRTLILEGGADAKMVGSSLREMDFAITQAAGENRIAVAGGVPSIVVGLKEGLQAATYSNYQQAMRRFADLTGHPLWRSLVRALDKLVEVPADAELWYDTSGIAALREDSKQQAEIDQRKALTLESLVRAGYTPESAIEAITHGDLTRLIHTGLYSVQLQPPVTNEPTASDAPANAAADAEADAKADTQETDNE